MKHNKMSTRTDHRLLPICGNTLLSTVELPRTADPIPLATDKTSFFGLAGHCSRCCWNVLVSRLYFPQFDLGSKSGGTSWDRKQFQNRHNSMTKTCSCQHQLPAVKLGNSFQWGAWQKQNPYYSVKVLYEKVNVKLEQI